MTASDDCDARIQVLIRETAQGEAVLHACVAAVHSEEARALLLDRAYRFARAAAALRALARERGVEPPAVTDVELPAQADDVVLLGECARREDRVIVAFRDALEESLPAQLRRNIEREFDSLLGRLGNLRVLRDRLARHVVQEKSEPAL